MCAEENLRTLVLLLVGYYMGFPFAQNEAMTGVFDFNPVFSRLTLAVLEDSGWYSVDYSAAEPLLWGRGRGCGFIDQGCGDMLS